MVWYVCVVWCGVFVVWYVCGVVCDAVCVWCPGDVESAQSTLQHCLDQDATFSDAHILMAQVAIGTCVLVTALSSSLFQSKMCTSSLPETLVTLV